MEQSRRARINSVGGLRVTVFDYAVLAILACSIVISLMRGLVGEILSLLGWAVAFVVANACGETFSDWLPAVIPGKAVRLIVAFVVLFIGTRLLMALVNKAAAALIQAAGLSLADRGLGGLFGLARGVLLVLAGVLLCGTTAMPRQDFWRNALLSPLAESAALTALPYLPGEFARYVKF